MADIAEVHAVVSGRVQGVCFRAATQRAARLAGVRGWVRNLPGRQVEAVLQGERRAVETILDFLRVGPPGASVTGVEVSWRMPGETYHEFDIRY
ncbi:MAG: acylphosphatase [Deltaproteobacteria bacterium]|nr:acylphosphatase [Deltaproteobacteria bacterium]